VGYKSVADNTGLFIRLAVIASETRNVAKFQENLTLQQFKVIQGNRFLVSMESPYVTH